MNLIGKPSGPSLPVAARKIATAAVARFLPPLLSAALVVSQNDSVSVQADDESSLPTLLLKHLLHPPPGPLLPPPASRR